MRDILIERPETIAEIGWEATQGVVSDSGPRRLLASYEAELAEHRRLLAGDKLTLQAELRRLAALFPVPPAPAPQPPAPPRRRSYPPLSELLAQRPNGRSN